MTTHDLLRSAGQNARVTRVTSEMLAHFRAFTDTSKAVTHANARLETIRRSWTESATDRQARRGAEEVQRFVRGSRGIETVERLASMTTRITSNAIEWATITDLAHLTEQAIRSSWLYRWLTAEPEPEVIVIDLRDTISVGPFITVLDELLRTLVPASHRSRVRSVAEAGHNRAKAAPVRVASIVLLFAVLASLMVMLMTGEPSQASLISHLLLLVMAALGTRVMMTWDELVETRAARLLVAALEPPEPPEDFDNQDR